MKYEKRIYTLFGGEKIEVQPIIDYLKKEYKEGFTCHELNRDRDFILNFLNKHNGYGSHDIIQPLLKNKYLKVIGRLDCGRHGGYKIYQITNKPK